MMPDGSINVKITAEAAGFISGVNQSADTLKKLETELSGLQAQLAKTTAEVALATAGWSAQAKAAAEAQSTAAIRSEIAAREGQIRQIQTETVARRELAAAAAAMAKSDAEAAGNFGVRYTIPAEAVESIEQATEAHGRLKFATAGTTREFIVLG